MLTGLADETESMDGEAIPTLSLLWWDEAWAVLLRWTRLLDWHGIFPTGGHATSSVGMDT